MSKPDHDRYIYLYTSSKKQKEHYEALASDAGLTLSHFLLIKIEEALADDRPHVPAQDLRARVAALEEELQRKDIMLQSYRNALARRDTLTWLDDTEDQRKISHRIIDALRTHGPIYEERLLMVLGIDLKDIEMARAVSTQLEYLEGFGLVKKGARGWRWV